MTPRPRAERLACWMLRARRLAVFNSVGYFDEAGIHSQSRVIVVAGYVASKRDWRRLEIKWKKALKKEGVDYYHTTDIEADPPRGIYQGWTRARADKLTDRIYPLAVEYASRPFGVHIERSTWYAAVPFVERFLPGRPHDGPYMLLAKHCIETVIDSQPEGCSEQVGFVFAENDFTDHVVRGYRTIKEVSPRPSLFGPFATDRMRENVMLQAADLLAWHYRRANEIRKRLRPLQIHRATLPLLENGTFRYVPRDEYCAQVAGLFEKYGAEWNRQVYAKMVEENRQRAERRARAQARRQGNFSRQVNP